MVGIAGGSVVRIGITYHWNEHPICSLYIAREVWLTQDEGLGS